MRKIQDIAHAIATQDNRCTSHPYVIVEQKVVDVGYKPELSCGGLAFIDDATGQPVPESHWKKIEEAYHRGDIEIDIEDVHYDFDMLTAVGYKERWEFVQAFLTVEGAELFIKNHGHTMNEPRTYIVSGWRNAEVQILRSHFLQMNQAQKSCGT